MTLRVIVDNAYRDRMAATGLRAYGDFLALCDRGEAISSSRSGRTFRVPLGDGASNIDGFLKVHDYSYWRRSRWRRDKGALEAANYAIMRHRCGLNTPDVIAYGARTGGLRYREGFILTRAIDGAQSLDAYADAHGGTISEGIAIAVAALTRQMHAAGFCHVDLQWRNILVAGGEAGGAVQLCLLDSPRGGLRTTRVSQWHGRVRDLSSLYKGARHRLTPRAQLRWLKTYLGGRRLTNVDRAMVRVILRDRASKDRT
ncbi:MAG TPA: lipopolysaccharide kinase InaA family protein [Phycisphaerae bacterium]|nr:lipopolysaccharide kinase InaA family protein [Phycisphaerae bacterium]HRW52931.1 lipopolysaccharide kinase InaA family protein [Phycisphaerae bacterium]